MGCREEQKKVLKGAVGKIFMLKCQAKYPPLPHQIFLSVKKENCIFQPVLFMSDCEELC